MSSLMLIAVKRRLRRMLVRVRFHSFTVAEGIGFEHELDLIPNAAECVDLGFPLTLSVRGIFEAPVVAIHLAGEGGADLIGVAADGDDCGDPLVEVLV